MNRLHPAKLRKAYALLTLTSPDNSLPSILPTYSQITIRFRCSILQRAIGALSSPIRLSNPRADARTLDELSKVT